MTQFEDLLRSALTDAPTPVTSLADPLADLDRRIGRAKLRIGGVAMAAVAVLVAAIVVPVTLVGRHHAAPPVPVSSSAPEFARWHGTVDDVTSGGGAVWALAEDQTQPGIHYVVEQRSPVTGAVLRRYAVPTTAPDGMWFGAGQVWIANGGENSRAQTIALTALDPATGAIANATWGQTQSLVSTMAFAGDRAWLAASDRVGQVQRSGIRLNVTMIGTTQHVVTTMLAVPQPSPSELLVDGGETAAIPGAAATAVRPAYRPGWLAFANAGGSSVWAAKGDNLVATGRNVRREDFDASGRRTTGSLIFESAPPIAIVTTSDGGLFVALDHAKFNPGVPIEYYSPTDLLADEPMSSSTYQAGQVVAMVANPAGGVVLATERGHLVQWNPASTRPPRTPPNVPTQVGRASQVAAGGGYVWTLRQDYHHSHAANGANDAIVVRRDHDTLDPLQSYRVPGPADFMAYGLGRVWVWGGGDGAYPDSYLSVVRASNGHVSTEHIVGHRPISDVRFEAGSAWLMEELPSEVVRVTVSGDAVTLDGHVLATDATSLAVGNGVVYALSSPTSPSGPQDTIVTIDAQTGKADPRPHADGHVVAVLPDGFLVVRNGVLVREDAAGSVVSTPLTDRVRYADVAESSNGRVIYVALERPNCRAASCMNLLAYPTSALLGGTAASTAATHLPGMGTPSAMAVDPTGALVFVQGNRGTLYHWTP